jgi:inorganic pyrophosphatase
MTLNEAITRNTRHSCTLSIKNSEIEILIGCSEGEKQLILEAHNNSEYMKGILIQRDAE